MGEDRCVTTRSNLCVDAGKLHLNYPFAAVQVPAGSLPRTIDVIMRQKAVETANPGDKACFTGMLVVVPDISAMTLPGNVSVKSECEAAFTI